MKQTITLLFTLLFCSASCMLRAQCDNYLCKMELARDALKNRYYKSALDLARGAESYDRDKKYEVNKFIDEVFDAIEKEKQVAINAEIKEKSAREAAEKSRITAVKAKELADSLSFEAKKAERSAVINLKKAEEQSKRAQLAEEESLLSLRKYLKASAEIVDLYVREVNQYILAMNYDTAELLLNKAASFGRPTPKFRKALTELAYWQNETGFPSAAASLITTYKQGNPTNETTAVRAFLAQYEPAWYDSLGYRYYGKLLSVTGGSFNFKNENRRSEKSIKAGKQGNTSVSNFGLGETEITFWQYGLFCKSTGKDISKYAVPYWGYKGHDPIINVSWVDAAEYANWLSDRFGLVRVYSSLDSKKFNQINLDANGFRLPTETEWEFAAKSGINHEYSQYAGSDAFYDVAWVPKNSSRTQPVAIKKPNKLGFYDMSGNVWEWCNDWYGSYPTRPGQNYQGPKSGSRMVVRGGAWNYDVKVITRSGYRIKSTPTARLDCIGFRIARSMQNHDTLPSPFVAKGDGNNAPLQGVKSDSLTQQASRFILQMDYQKAEEEILEIINVKSTPSLQYVVNEVAFWLNETGASRHAADFLAQCNRGIIDSNFYSIREYLFQNNKECFSTLINRYYGKMIDIEGGSFFFHHKTEAAVSNFKIAQTETTFWQYGLYCAQQKKDIKRKDEPGWVFTGAHPVINVSWYEALAYANWLSERMGLKPVYDIIGNGKNSSSGKSVKIIPNANGYRLPTETEWEYAAKGGKVYRAFQFAGSDDFYEVGWGSKNSFSPQPVAQKKPNSLNIYDLSGNVSEWCWDKYSDFISYPLNKKLNYPGPKYGHKRIVRGGNWNKTTNIIERATINTKTWPGTQSDKIGFRLVTGNN